MHMSINIINNCSGINEGCKSRKGLVAKDDLLSQNCVAI